MHVAVLKNNELKVFCPSEDRSIDIVTISSQVVYYFFHNIKLQTMSAVHGQCPSVIMTVIYVRQFNYNRGKNEKYSKTHSYNYNLLRSDYFRKHCICFFRTLCCIRGACVAAITYTQYV